MRTEEEVSQRVAELREQFEGVFDFPPLTESERNIYVLRILPDAIDDARAMKFRTFPYGSDYPDLIDEPKGCVYIGLTWLSPEDRFEVHKSRASKASKIAKLGYLHGESYDESGRDLTSRFGFSNVGWRNSKPERLESWLAWNFYLMGYWVWGAHHHKDEKFLGITPFH